MLNASAHHSYVPLSTRDSPTTPLQETPYQVCHTKQMSHATYHISQQDHLLGYMGALVGSGANSGMARSDTCVLSTVPHAHVDNTGVGGSITEHLPLVHCASVVDTVDEGNIMIIMSQYAHKPDSKTIHSKSQVEHFGGIAHNSALTAGGHQMVITHEGYAIPFISAMVCIIWTCQWLQILIWRVSLMSS